MNFTPSNGSESKQLMICRCCLNENCFKDISAEFNDFARREVYQEMLKDVFNIQNVQDISVKQHICDGCVIKLQNASDFKQMVVQNEKIYLKYLQNFLTEIDSADTELQKSEDIKQEVAQEIDFDMKFNDHDDNYDDNESNLRNEPDKINILAPTSSIKDNEIEATNTQELSKIIERRGTGPILRENSMKLLANSTATVFQWNKSRYRCFCCKEPYSDTLLLKAHTEKQHTLEEIQKKIITQQNRLVKVEISILNCKICNEKLKDLDNLKEHLIKHSIVVKDHLLIPFKIENKLKCQICSDDFTQFRLLNIHMNKHYLKHVCHICGSGFSNLVFLNLHRTRSHRPIRCLKCDVDFVSRAERNQHDVKIHGAKKERRLRFPCPYCQERFYQENLRVKHLVDKHGLKRPEFKCQFCSKSFITRSLVNNHIKTVHMKEKNHECEVCHSFFYTKSDVARHRVTHTGDKNFACVICANLFATKDSLRRHMKRTHSMK